MEVRELLEHRHKEGGAHEDGRHRRQCQIENPPRLAEEPDGIEENEHGADDGSHEERQAVRADKPRETEGEVRKTPRIAHDDLVEAEDDPGHEDEEAEFSEGLPDKKVGGKVTAPRVEEGRGKGAKARCREPACAEIRAVRHRKHADDNQALVGGDDPHPALHQQGGRVQEQVGIEQPGRVSVAGKGLVVDHGRELAEPEVDVHGMQARQVIVEVVPVGKPRHQQRQEPHDHQYAQKRHVETVFPQPFTQGVKAAGRPVDDVH